MDKELEKYYENRFSMMADPGWKQLMEDVETMKQNYSLIESINDEKSLFIRKGQLDIINWLLNLKKISEEAYEQLKNESL